MQFGLVNKVVPDDQLQQGTMEMALQIADRGSYALAGVKAAFGARHQGVAGLARLSHDLLVPQYYASEETHELADAFANRRKPDASKFGH